MSVIIKAENLSKKYHLGQTHTNMLSERIGNGLRSFCNKVRGATEFAVPSPQSPCDEFWALNDVNFEVKQGDVVGIIGRNGAGKSTLLKILSRITTPTSGSVEIYGRVASLLEVGTGFHPELTGRENVFLNGAILGMSKAEIRLKFDEIVSFAEVEKFIDTPVKRYSSGMYVRLAFAVAAHLEPEILIVDEVLAVGDAQFQKKCLGKMQEVGAEGRTVLFVSHNMAAIKTLCSRGIVLSNGQMIFQGDINEAVGQYQGPDGLDKNDVYWGDIADAPGNENIRLKSISVRPIHSSVIDIDSGIEISTVFYNTTAGRSLDFTLYLFNLDGVCLFETGIIISNNNDAAEGYFSTKGFIPPNLLNAGIYKINLVFGESQRYVLYKIDDVISFEVEHTATGRGSNMSRAPGIIRPRLDWSYEFLSH